MGFVEPLEGTFGHKLNRKRTDVPRRPLRPALTKVVACPRLSRLSLSPTFHVPDFPDFSWASWLSRSGPWRCQIMAELFRSSGFKNNAASVFCLLILPDSDHFGQG